MVAKQELELGRLRARGLEQHCKTPRSLRAATVVGNEIRVEMVEGRGNEEDPLRAVVYWFHFDGGLSRPVEGWARIINQRSNAMFGIRGWWARHSDAIKSKLQWILNPARRELAAKAVATTINLMEQAMPYVKMIASLTPTTADDILLAAAEKIGVKIEDIIAEPDWHRKVGLIQDLGGEALREKLKQLLPTFDHGLEIAGVIVTSAEGLDAISHNAFHAPVVLAVNALRAAGEIESALQDAQVTAPLTPQG
jgi:hypothetical protein